MSTIRFSKYSMSSAIARSPRGRREFICTSRVRLLDDALLSGGHFHETTSLPGGQTNSYTDVLALARNDRGLCVLAVEAKVDEDFGLTASRWPLMDAAANITQQLARSKSDRRPEARELFTRQRADSHRERA
jgi:hypothetical protein